MKGIGTFAISVKSWRFIEIQKILTGLHGVEKNDVSMTQ